jgi:hypothetical protein
MLLETAIEFDPTLVDMSRAQARDVIRGVTWWLDLTCERYLTGDAARAREHADSFVPLMDELRDQLLPNGDEPNLDEAYFRVLGLATGSPGFAAAWQDTITSMGGSSGRRRIWVADQIEYLIRTGGRPSSDSGVRCGHHPPGDRIP